MAQRSAWGKLPTTAPVANLADVMSEELAQVFSKEDLLSASTIPFEKQDSNAASPNGCTSPTTDDDEMLARLLQEEFDREIAQETAVLNISNPENEGRNLRKGSAESDDDQGDSEEEDVDRFATQARTNPIIGFRGFSRDQDGTIKTKHDVEICGRRHACKVMEFTSNIATGDGAGFDMKLSNSVYNSLRVHNKSEERRAARLHDKKEKSTAEQSLDPNTRLLIYKLLNRDILEEVNGCISTGKESTVFHAVGGNTEEFDVPAECAVKVFKTTLNEFKNRQEYIKEDFRFKDRLSKLNPRKIIHTWAEKELYNLRKINRAGIRCPQAVILKKHVLVMEFIGSDMKPAPKLKDAGLPQDKIAYAYDQCVDILQKLYKECKLVHADFSEYNLLWHMGNVWVIDVSQSVDHLHPHALEFLLRDCTNISDFFRKLGCRDVEEPKIIFQKVCGLDIPGEGPELLSYIRNFVSEEDIMKRDNEHFHDQRDTFDIMFEHSGNLLDVATDSNANK